MPVTEGRAKETDFAEAPRLMPDPGSCVVRMQGPDSVDLLQRLTTNDMREIASHKAVTTALLSSVGRIQAVFTALRDGEDFLLISGPGEAEHLRNLLQGQIFFMDDVLVEDASRDWSVLQVAADRADVVLEALGFETRGWQDGEVRQAGTMRSWAQAQLGLPNFTLLLPTGERDGAADAMRRLGGAVAAAPEDLHRERILGKRAGYGGEFNGEYNPLELGMRWICNDHKGCYPGQEVIARQITYGKVARQLSLIRITRPAAAGTPVKAGESVAGVITSATFCENAGTGHALAVLRSAAVRSDKTLTVHGEPALLC